MSSHLKKEANKDKISGKKNKKENDRILSIKTIENYFQKRLFKNGLWYQTNHRKSVGKITSQIKNPKTALKLKKGKN